MKKYGLILFSILVLSLLVSGKYISLTTQISREEVISKNETQLKIKLLNSGDETAYNVKVNFLSPSGFQAPSLSVGNLAPNLPYSQNVTLKLPDLLPGQYSLLVLTSYQDVNAYPFSSLSFTTLTVKRAVSSSVFGIISSLKLAGKEPRELTLKVRNLGNKRHEVKATLHLPRELKANSYEKNLILRAKEEKALTFSVSSLGALPGSSYPVFASLTYEENNLHHSSLARGTINIVEESQLKKEEGNLDLTLVSLILSFIILIVISLYYKKHGK